MPSSIHPAAKDPVRRSAFVALPGMMSDMDDLPPIREKRGSPSAQADAFAICDLDYDLPEELIARTPAVRRDAARLLRVNRRGDSLSDHTVAGLPDLLEPGDLLVMNNTRVIPARFTARRPTGGIVRGLFLDEPQPNVWHVMLEGSRRLRVSETLAVHETVKDLSIPKSDAQGLPSSRKQPSAQVTEIHGIVDGSAVHMELIERHSEGHWLVRVDRGEPAADILERIGETPLPPYIGRKGDGPDPDSGDRARYQTVYATAPGAVAAPTAGLHFTHELLEAMHRRGIETTFVTLHVGLGTFKPITVDRLSDHRMHREWFDLSESAADAINACRARGGRVVAVGTTSVRVLETAAQSYADLRSTSVLLAPCRGWTDIFIYPPYSFACVDAMLTNFHLPRSTLLALVMAFAGIGLTRRAYQHAITERYRFYSYGDAMLLV